MRHIVRTLVVAAAYASLQLLAPTRASAEEGDDFEVSITPYLWLAGIEGDIGGTPGNPPVNVDASFNDVFDSLDSYFMGKIELRYDRFGLIGDFDHLEISGSDEVRIGNLLAINSDVSVGTDDGTIAAYYRVYQDQSFTIDVLGGARYTSVDFDIGGDVNGTHFDRGDERDWWDPVLGIRAHWQTDGRLGVTGYGDYGGFGVSSDAVWQVYAAGGLQTHRHDRALRRLSALRRGL